MTSSDELRIRIQRIEQDILEVLRKNGELSQRRVQVMVSGDRNMVCNLLRSMSEEGRISVRHGPRGALMYDLPLLRDPDEPMPEAAPDERIQVIGQSGRTGWDDPAPDSHTSPEGQPEAFWPVCVRCAENGASSGGLFCDSCALLSRKEAGLGG
jgi:hypothetical protein